MLMFADLTSRSVRCGTIVEANEASGVTRPSAGVIGRLLGRCLTGQALEQAVEVLDGEAMCP